MTPCRHSTSPTSGLSRRLVGSELTVEHVGAEPEVSQVDDLAETPESPDITLTEGELSHISSTSGTPESGNS